MKEKETGRTPACRNPSPGNQAQNRRQKMRGVARLGLFNDGIALRHALKAVNGLSNTAEKSTSQKKNTEETRHIRNLLNSGRCLRGFARV